MSQKTSQSVDDYLNEHPHADIEDIMFFLPHLTPNEASTALRRHRRTRFLMRWWPLFLLAIAGVAGMVALVRFILP